MPVVLTGDIHHRINSGDQYFTDHSEASLSVDYTRIAAQYGLNVTLFFTGRAIVEDGNEAKGLLAMDNVEIGGHGWDALRPRWWHMTLKLLTGSPHGPAWLQRRMIHRTCRTIEQYTSQPVSSWRSHAYRYDQQTSKLLSEAGIKTWSDKVSFEHHWPLPQQSGMISLPINTLPDHENLYHGARTPERVTKQGAEPSYTPEEWYNRVSAQVKAIASKNRVATILAHPICMKVADDFVTFERLCSFLSRYPSIFASEAPNCIPSS